jgi:two-component system cell cycle sensor histidine kinase/response regulator CckA
MAQKHNGLESAAPEANSEQTLRERAEKIVLEREAKSREKLETKSLEEIRQLVHDERVRQTELEMQNESLRESEARLRASAENIVDRIVPSDRSGRIAFVNHLQTGLTSERVLSSTVFDFVTPEQRSQVENALTAVFERGESSQFESIGLGPDGESRTYDVSVSPIFVGDQIISAAFLARDITVCKGDEGNLRISEERFRRMFDNSASGMVLVSPEFNFLHVNNGFCRMLGYSETELLGKSFQEVTHPEDRRIGGELVSQVLSGQTETFQLEKRYLRKDGAVVWGLLSTSLIRDARNKPLHFVTQIVDITERKRAETARRESEERLQRAELIAGFGNFEIDLNTNVVSASENAVSIYGAQVSESSLALVQRFPLPEYRKMLDDALRGLVTEGKLYDVEFKICRESDGAIVHIHSVAKYDETSNVVFGTIHDITDRKRAEEEKAKLEVQLQQAQKMESVGRLAGGVAHDFNNMLTVILGHAEMALDQLEPTQPLHAALLEIQDCAQHATDLTRQLLAFARKQTITPKILDLNETVESVLKMLQKIIGEDINLIWRPDANLWPVKVDPSQIDQILANLCANARDAIVGVGKVTIETRNRNFDADYCASHAGLVPGEYVSLEVSDDGWGMNEETLSSVFEPFFTTKEVDKGTGLGLATVYGIVKQNSGYINAYSKPDVGTTFTIYLPRHVGTAEQKQKKVTAGSAPRGKETILLVEDAPEILKMITKILERQGYTVLAASAPDEAIRLAEEHKSEIHLLMTDVIMPKMNGRDLAIILLSVYPHLRCLFTSGYTADVFAHRGVLDETVNFIQKPFSPNDLSVKIREVLDKG